LAALVAAGGCRTRDQACATTCAPACPSGSVCAADIRDDISATWEGVCLHACAHPADCPAGLSCRNFSDAGFLCASDSVPSFCPVVTEWTIAGVGHEPRCLDAETATREFESSLNGSNGVEMIACANGCSDGSCR
jgi:hypothetical protein